MNVIDAGSGIKYQSAIGSHGQVNEGILVRYLFTFGGKQNLQTASFRITRYIGNVFITNAAQIWQERPKNSILFSDELCHVICPVYAISESVGQQSTIIRNDLLPVSLMDWAFI